MDHAAKDLKLRSIMQGATSALTRCDFRLLESLAAYCEISMDGIGNDSNEEATLSKCLLDKELQVFGQLLQSTAGMHSIFHLLERNRRGQLEYHPNQLHGA